MTVTVQPPDAVAFQRFGAFLKPPAVVGERSRFDHWLQPLPGLSQRCHLNRVAPSTLPLTLERVERHPHASQVFLPMCVSRYLVTVMPSDSAGGPDATQARSFLLPGTVGVVYHAGTWHAGVAALDAEASFAVLMCRGAEDDDVFAGIPALEVRAAGSDAQAAGEGRDHG